MELAVSAAGRRGEPAAWSSVELGKLHFGRGDLTGAEAAFRAALIALPGYPFALDWLARVEAARGRVREAIRLSRAAVETVPLPQFAATLTDLLRLDGREREAREQERLVASIERLLGPAA